LVFHQCNIVLQGLEFSVELGYLIEQQVVLGLLVVNQQGELPDFGLEVLQCFLMVSLKDGFLFVKLLKFTFE
jgi:hypothetical protein